MIGTVEDQNLKRIDMRIDSHDVDKIVNVLWKCDQVISLPVLIEYLCHRCCSTFLGVVSVTRSCRTELGGIEHRVAFRVKHCT